MRDFKNFTALSKANCTEGARNYLNVLLFLKPWHLKRERDTFLVSITSKLAKTFPCNRGLSESLPRYFSSGGLLG